MFWNWFLSDRKVTEALSQSTGYDMSPNVIQAPANTDVEEKADENGKPKLTLWTDYTYTPEETEIKIEQYWATVANDKR